MEYSQTEILQTVAMTEMEHLDVRTVTLSLSLRDCASESIARTAERVSEKILRVADRLVATVDAIGDEIGIRVANKRIAITPVSMITEGARGDVTQLARVIDSAAIATGVDFIGCAIRVALGERIAAEELEPKRQVPVIQRYAFPKPGRVIDVRGGEIAKHVPGIAEVIVTARPGDIIPPAGDKRPSGAMVLATGRNREEALAAANAGLSAIEIETR